MRIIGDSSVCPLLLPLSLTLEHRVLTGGEAGGFLAGVMADLQLPESRRAGHRAAAFGSCSGQRLPESRLDSNQAFKRFHGFQFAPGRSDPLLFASLSRNKTACREEDGA